MSILALLALAACGEADAPMPGADAEKIACAIDGGQTLDRQCWVEREGSILTLHQGDGGFHRLRIVDGGRGVVAADGAEAASLQSVEGGVEVAIGDARYRLPTNPDGTIR